MDNRERLKQLKDEHHLTRKQLAILARCSEDTMDCYLNPPTSKNSLECPDHRIDWILDSIKKDSP